ncbi:hypothetical protein [Nocardioides lianchengensis]|uniref:ABC-2 family transporter protein n=1 Tax=Nocardioides lianchengensis TaxID=1045774 RepID=A0A1G7A039_9ACTN|nr:hypothetical protein [Nocardioides lianchengensis]NYG12302.1 hypothetical protein [Nocardioides lianchengensis]SDE08192.1 hypothetical protein SAMN05421872_114123 [Nocardioides lianchengensis]
MSTTTRRTRPAVAAVLGLVAGLVVALVVLAFLWPVATSEPHDLPVGVVGGQLPASADLPVDPTSYDSRADAVRAIQEREVYGALVLDPAAPEVLVAGAGQAPATAVVQGLGAQMGAAQGVTPTVTDVVPLSEDDPAGAGLSAMGFPLVLGGIVGGVLVSLLVAGVTRRLLALGVYAAAAGLLAAVVTGPLLGIAAGGFWTSALVLAVAMLGTASTVVGLNALLGAPGIGVGAVLTMLVANPISGGTTPYQFITGPWGEIGQYFVPGAAQSLFREVSYFPDASTLHEWVVLVAWVLGGVLLSVTGHFRSSTPVDLPDDELEAA